MSSGSRGLLEFFKLIGKLKSTKRTGWVLRGVRQPESIADHMYRMSVMAFLATPELDKDRCVKMAVVHDMAECIVGDLVPSDPITKEEKHRQERAAMDHIKGLVDAETGQELYKLWEEYEYQQTAEARFVKDLDRFDMILQAHEYEEADQKPGFLQEFYDSTQGKFSHPVVCGWVEELNRQRSTTLSPNTGHSEAANALSPQDSQENVSSKNTLNTQESNINESQNTDR